MIEDGDTSDEENIVPRVQGNRGVPRSSTEDMSILPSNPASRYTPNRNSETQKPSIRNNVNEQENSSRDNGVNRQNGTNRNNTPENRNGTQVSPNNTGLPSNGRNNLPVNNDEAPIRDNATIAIENASDDFQSSADDIFQYTPCTYLYSWI